MKVHIWEMGHIPTKFAYIDTYSYEDANYLTDPLFWQQKPNPKKLKDLASLYLNAQI